MQLKMTQSDIEMLKYETRFEILKNTSEKDKMFLDNERSFIRQKIKQTKDVIAQLEANIQFFKYSSSDNPLVKEVHNKMDKHKRTLDLWKQKLTKVNAFVTK